MDVETAGTVAGRGDHRRTLAVLVGVAALWAAALTVLHAELGRREERALLRGSRLSAIVFERIAVRGVLADLEHEGLRLAAQVGWEGTARQTAAASGGGAADLAVGTADVEAGLRIQRLARALAPSAADVERLDRHAAEVLSAPDASVDALVAEQNREIGEARALGTRADRATLALSMLAVAAVLLGLAALVGRGRPALVSLVAGAVVLLGSLAWGGWAALG
jgi:hypothetical protein